MHHDDHIPDGDRGTGFLAGAGELGGRIATFDWAATPIGAMDRWPAAMTGVLGFVLRSPLPIVTLWGDSGVMIYNDAYRTFAGARHPSILGTNVLEGWHEVADFNARVMAEVYRDGGTLSFRDQELTLVRDGTPRTLWTDLEYSPVPGPHGTPIGVVAIVVETTEKVLADRRAAEEQRRLMKAQAAIDASEAQFRTFAQVLPGHIWTSPPDGVIDWFNDRVAEYAGGPVAELLAAGWASILHPDDVADAMQRWAGSLATGDIYETEMRIRRHDGAYRWHLVRAVPIRDDDGLLLRWIGTNTDIHEQRLSHAQSAADRDRLWTLSKEIMLICTLQGTITAVNPSATRLLGWQEEEMVGHDVAGFLHPEDVHVTARELEKLAVGITTLAFENRYRTRDGNYRMLSWTAVPEGDRVHAVGRDITEERELARDRDRVWKLSPVLKVVTNRSGHIIDVNPSWTRTLGWSRADTIGKRSTDFMVDDESDWGRRVDTLASGTRLVDYRTTLRTREGRHRIIQWSTVPEDGNFYGFGRDVTAEVEAAAALADTEAALRQSQKMEAVGQLTGGIAHDFNNLLQGITGSLEIVRRRIAQGRIAELDRFIVGAATAADRAAALTHRLLAFSRRQPLAPRMVRANALVASMEDLLRRTIGESIELEMVLAGGLWATRCDPNQLESALLNLAINARDAMPDGGHLTIETCNAHLDSSYAARQRGVKPGQYVCICVTDTGTGMDADTIAKAFEPFFTTKPIGQGTGLGLSMIYGFAQQSEGYAKIYSEVGQGTTFKLYLPRHRGEDEEEEPLPALTGAHVAEDGEVVLVVEDEAVVRGLIVEELRELRYRTLEAVDGPAGLEVLRSKRRIDLLVTDIGLPGLNGRQVADAARVLRPELKVLFMTGYAENAALASGFLEPGMDMITKPFAMEALATRIRTMLGGRPDDVPGASL